MLRAMLAGRTESSSIADEYGMVPFCCRPYDRSLANPPICLRLDDLPDWKIGLLVEKSPDAKKHPGSSYVLLQYGCK